MGKPKLLTILTAVIFFLGCASNKNVYFFDREPIRDQNAYSIFIDAFGNIYPETGFPEDTEKYKSFGGSIFNMMVDPRSDLCENISTSDSNEALQLCGSVAQHVCNTAKEMCPTTMEWQKEQNKLWRKTAAQIYELSAQNSKRRDIIFLVHGFNVVDSREDYDLLRDRINEMYKNEVKPFYVEINWDGFSKISNWGAAQASGPLVGFHIRKLFNYLSDSFNAESQPKIIILTHSSGAFIAGAILGDPTAALKLLSEEDKAKSDYIYFKEHICDAEGIYRIPVYDSLGVGMLAAATPSTTFVDHEENGCSKLKGVLTKNAGFVFSINPNDLALKKGIFNSNNSLLGASGSGSDIDTYCLIQKGFIQRENTQNIKAYALDFSSGHRSWQLRRIGKSHSIRRYLEHSNMDNFLHLLLNDEENAKQYVLDCP